ncbi:MAG: 2-(1,2-epoxy,2-dihydrophenyl)acetyl-CoA isomerase [Thermoplasmata archaeon]|jgi:2-(1,2-epoxy-1,2-dihydrophenyl)acetyl-CoA isomerase|nr:2-(1,2-epoxy,2-dihydrophenyl)acetyl-CoA isomerase [Thermoplasmata archaeon]
MHVKTPAPVRQVTDPPSPASQVALRHEEGGVAVVQFTRAESMNSFDPVLLRHLRQVFGGLLLDDAVRAIVLTGSGKAFSSGADVGAFEHGIATGTATQWVLDATAELHPLLHALHVGDKPLVAAVNGVAAGGGLGLALVADARVAGPGARFAASYFRMGLSPDGGATWLLPRLIGEQRTRRFLFENQVLGADDALACGLVDEVVPDDQLLPRALEVARKWGAWSRLSRGSTKRLLESQAAASFAAQLDAERGLIAAAAGTADFVEGVAAFREKRQPRFA